MLTFANPLGLLALLGIPALLAIHFLQRKAVVLPVSTLFLLERTQRDAASGRRWDRLVPSIPLWMQLLAILLLAWLLAEPRYRKSGSVQRVAIVLDSSASMTVFKDELVKQLVELLPKLQGPAGSMEITLLESATNRPRVYTGVSLEEAAKALSKWRPRDGLTDPGQALRLARSLISREGTLIYATDTPADSLPFDARLLAVGSPVENIGFTGVSFFNEGNTTVWRAIVRNYGDSPANRTWQMRTDSGGTEPRALHLEPRALVTLQAAFPTDAKDVRVVLSNDAFPLDNVLPLVKPQPKPLTVAGPAAPVFAALTTKLIASLDAAVPAPDPALADLAVVAYDPLDPVLPAGNAIVFVNDDTRAGAYLKGGIFAESHPLLDGLNWQSLLVRETIGLEVMPSDQVILRQDKRPLIFTRGRPAANGQAATTQLFFNFDLRLSNADTQPAFIVLLHRFAEAVREAKVAPAAMMLETSQPIRITSETGVPMEIKARDLLGKPLPHADVSSAPADPGFLTISQQDKPLLDAAVFFADTREADFTACGSVDRVGIETTSSVVSHTRPDPLWRGWILLLLAVLLVSWKFTGSRLTPDSASA